MPVDPQLAPLLDLIQRGTPLHEMSPAQARASFRKLAVDLRPAASIPQVGSVADATVAGGSGPLKARVYRPAADGPVPTVVLFHGGGFVIGDLDTHDAMARAICAGTGAVVVSVDYRLGPEARFPAAADDAIAAVSDVKARLAAYGGSDVLALAGDSAGGNLAAVAAQHVSGIAAQLLVYPAVDVVGEHHSREENKAGYFLEEETMVWFIGNYADADTDLTDPKISPLFGDLAGQPPAVIVTAEFDPLRDEGIAYADKLRAAGVEVDHTTVPGMIHGFFDMGPWSTAAQAVVDDSIGRYAELLRRAVT